MKPSFTSAAAGLLIAGLAFASPAMAADGFALASGSLRAGPASDYPVVGNVGRGETLVVYGCVARYVWCDVSASGERGWFLGRRIAFEREGRRVPLPTVATVVGLSIVGFAVNDYWGAHYRGRPWFEDRRWRHGPRDGWRDHRPPSAVMPMHRGDGDGAGPAQGRRPPRETLREHGVKHPPRPIRYEAAPRPTRSDGPHRAHPMNRGGDPRQGGGHAAPPCKDNCR